MSEKEPGQLAYETFNGSIPATHFADFAEVYRDAWACVEAAIRADERERCAKVADAHLARIPDHNPDVERDDLVAQGYGNAALNIGCAIRALGSKQDG